MTSPADVPNIIPRNQYALFVRGQDGEPYYKIIQDLEAQQDFLVAGLPALIATAQATADAALGLLTPFLAVNRGGTGLTGGTSGGILGFTGATTLASSGLLAAHSIMLGGGAGVVPSTPVALGTSGWVLTSQGAGVDPVFAAVPGVASAALSRTNDTNVTLTLGGTPATALLQATSITAGWTGQLSVARGGTGAATLTNHGVLLGAGTGAVSATAVGATGTVLHGVTGADPTYSAVSLTADVTGTLAVANGGTGLATLTAHALYVGNAAAAPTALAVGATNTVLHGNTGADPSFSAVVEADITLADNTTNNVSNTKHGFAPKNPNDATKYLDGTGAYSTPAGAAAGALILIQTQVIAAGTAVVDFTTGINSTYDEYVVVLTNVTPTTTNTSLYFRVSEDGGATFKAGASDYEFTAAAFVGPGATVSSSATGATTRYSVNAAAGIYNGAGAGGVCGELKFFKPSSTTLYKKILSTIHYSGVSDTNQYLEVNGGRYIGSVNAINAIRFLQSSGTLAQGTISLYGVAK